MLNEYANVVDIKVFDTYEEIPKLLGPDGKPVYRMSQKQKVGFDLSRKTKENSKNEDN